MSVDMLATFDPIGKFYYFLLWKKKIYLLTGLKILLMNPLKILQLRLSLYFHLKCNAYK